MKDFFKPEDFDSQTVWSGHSKSLAAIANAKLAKEIESWPVVWFNDDKTMSPYWEASSRQDKLHTHKARLAFIEEIEKKECKHLVPKLRSDRQVISSGNLGADLLLGCSVVCASCGVELQATWSEKK